MIVQWFKFYLSNILLQLRSEGLKAYMAHLETAKCGNAVSRLSDLFTTMIGTPNQRAG